MKKSIFVLASTLTLIGFNNTVKCQDPQTNLNKYWHYRNRLATSFVNIGMGNNPASAGISPIPGQSIPMAVRNGDGNALAPDEGATWADDGRQIGYYIGMLATEYRLLADGHQNTNETVMELFYALHAVFRLDSLAIYWWNVNGRSFNGGITGGYPATFPGYGYMFNDDIAGSYCLPSDANTPIPSSDITSSPYYNSSTVVSVYGSGVVGPISNVGSAYLNYINEGASTSLSEATSKDNYFATLIGLTLAVNELDDNINSFIDQNGNAVSIMGYTTNSNNPNGCDLRSMALQLGQQLLQYIFNSGFYLKYPDGSLILSSSGDGSYYDCSYYVPPLINIAENFFKFPSSLDNFLNTYDPSTWYAESLCNINALTHLQKSGDIDIYEFPIELTALSNNGAGYAGVEGGIGAAGADLCISALGNFPHNTDLTTSYHCLYDPNLPGGVGNQAGWDQFYGLLHEVLYPDPGNLSYLNFCSIEDMLNSDPYTGPYRHDQHGIDIAGEWSVRRFIDPQNTDINGGFEGNLNGLDYMLLYNLYCITINKSLYNNPVTIPSEFVTFWPNLGGGIGDQYDPYTIARCNNFDVSELHVFGPGIIETGAGNLTLSAGNFSSIDLNPSPGNSIIIDNGAYFDANCNYTCCTPENHYGPSLVDVNTPTLRPIKPNDSDSTLPTYKKTGEFDAPSYNAIMNYPNPCINQTTIEFEVKENSTLNIYVYDLNGHKIQAIISNQTFRQGSYAIDFNTETLPAGTYICELVTQDDRKTTKMIKVE
jgi:hypothetical protein